MEKVENMLRLVFRSKLSSHSIIGYSYRRLTDLVHHLLNSSLKTFPSDELESNNFGFDADEILDQMNLVTFENSKSISESLILYLRQSVYHFFASKISISDVYHMVN